MVDEIRLHETKEKMIPVLDAELDRVTGALQATSPLAESYTRIAENLRTLFWMYRDILSESRYDCIQPEDVAESEVVEAVVVPPMADVPEETKEETKEEPKEEPIAEVDATDKASVRAFLSKASASGVQIKPVISQFTPEGKDIKFSSIPADKYPELVEAIKKEMEA